jgi:hypothetical protein
LQVDLATDADVLELSGQMRDVDQLEARLMTGLEPLEALLRQVDASVGEAWTLRDDDGALIVIFGVVRVSMAGGVVSPWMVASNRAVGRNEVVAFAKREVLPVLLKGAKYASGYVLATNKVGIRWLRFLGFTISDGIAISGRNFLKYEWRAE